MGLRITDQGLINSRRGWLEAGRTRSAEFERAIASGRRIENASDDPAVSTQLLRHDARLQRIAQYQRNAQNAKLWVGAADTALQSASNSLQRARTLAIQAGNDTLGAEENDAIAADIRALADDLRSLANTKLNGRSIFAGNAGTANAYDAGSNYLGDGGSMELGIDPGESVIVGAAGPDVFGPANPGDPLNGSVFEVLEALATSVENDDSDGVRDGIVGIDGSMRRMGSIQGRIGAVSQQLDAAENRHSSEKLSVETTVSKLRDTDVADAIIRLRSAEASYQATLAATARGMSVSLLDFLR